MRVVKIEKGKQEIVNYPRHDMGEIIGLSKDIVFFIIRENRPDFNEENEYLRETGITTTEENDSEFPHLKIAYRNYEAIQRVIEEDELTKKIKILEEAIVILSKDSKDRTQDEKNKMDEITGKIKTEKTKTLR